MVKQGKVAKSSRLRQLKQRPIRHQGPTTATIARDQLREFLLVRYHLTQHQHQSALVQETMQRFFQAWLDQTMAQPVGPWSIAEVTTTTLQSLTGQVPWQFYAIVVQAGHRWQRFLQKEVPAVPIAPRQLVTDPLATADLSALIARQVAISALSQLAAATPRSLTSQQIDQLQTSFYREENWQWTTVAALFTPLSHQVTPQADQATRDWLATLMAVTLEQVKNGI